MSLEEQLEILIERFHEALEYATDEHYVDDLANQIMEIEQELNAE